MIRRIHRSDGAQGEIVSALRKAGAKVWIIGRPCDLLVRYHDNTSLPLYNWQLIEIKKRPRKDQPEQTAFCRDHRVPVVSNVVEALAVIGIRTSDEQALSFTRN